jgi:hypothetical protein
MLAQGDRFVPAGSQGFTRRPDGWRRCARSGDRR